MKLYVIRHNVYHRFYQRKSTWSSRTMMWSTSTKNPLLNEISNTYTRTLKWLCQWNWYKKSFSLDFELHKWRHIFIYLLEQMANPLIFELICLHDRRNHTPETICVLAFWLRLYFKIQPLNLLYKFTLNCLQYHGFYSQLLVLMSILIAYGKWTFWKGKFLK